MRPLIAWAVLATASVSAGTVRAADIPGDRSTTATVGLAEAATSIFETRNDRDWFRIRLSRGQNYAFRCSSLTRSAEVRIRNPAGRQIGATEFCDSGSTTGRTFVPTGTGVHFLSVFGRDEVGPDTTYFASVRADIPENLSTEARLTLGKATTLFADFAGEADWLRLRLERGRTYEVALDVPDDAAASLTLREPSKAIVAQAIDSSPDDGRVTLTYRARVTGDHIVAVRHTYPSGRTPDSEVTARLVPAAVTASGEIAPATVPSGTRATHD